MSTGIKDFQSMFTINLKLDWVLHSLNVHKMAFFYRLAKEKVSYEQETEKLSQKINKMKTESGDDYNIKKQVIIARANINLGI